MKKYYLAALFLTVVMLGASASVLAQKAAPEPDTPPSFTLLSPKDGEVLRGGEEITLNWKLTLPQWMMESNWGEMEFFLETVEGVHARITPQMSLSARTYRWTVPNITSRGARFVLQAGVEGDGDFFLFAQTGRFMIKPVRGEPSIALGAARAVARPGENLAINWITTNLGRETTYEVLISYNRGGHFHRVATTKNTTFSLPIPDDFSGSVTVQIVARRPDGRTVSSLLTREATIRIRPDEVVP